MPEQDITEFFLPKQLKFICSRRFKTGYIWSVEKIRTDFEICLKCGTQCTVRCGKAYTTVKEAPVRGKPLWLHIEKHRYYCKTCRKPFTESVDCVWPRKRSTHQFKKIISQDCERFTDLDLVRKVHKSSSGFIYKVHYDHLKTKLNELKNTSWPSILGIDEHFFSRRRGYTEFATVFCDLSKKRLFEMCLGKDKKSIFEQVGHINGRDKVKTVVIDLSNGYLSLVRELFPNAKIVADKFHALRLITPALLKTRKNIHGHRQDLKSRRLLLKNRDELSYAVRSDIDMYLEKHPELNELYRVKEKLRQFYQSGDVTQAKHRLEYLIHELQLFSQESLQRLRRTLLKWKHELLNYFENKWTNGFTEAINGVAKGIQKRARGYKNFVNYRAKTLCACFY